MFKLQNTVGKMTTFQNVRIVNAVFFADDGFGNFIETDLCQVADFYLGDFARITKESAH